MSILGKTRNYLETLGWSRMCDRVYAGSDIYGNEDGDRALVDRENHNVWFEY